MWSRVNRLSAGPTDGDIHRVARVLQTPGEQRDRLTDGIYVPASAERPIGRLDRAMIASIQAEEMTSMIKQAAKAGKLPRGSFEEQLAAAVSQNIITKEQAALIQHAEMLRDDAVQVDSFTLAEYLKTSLDRA